MWEDIVANALLFKSADRLFGRKNQNPIGDTNIKSHTVAYTLSLLHELTDGKIDLGSIWSKQFIDEILERELKKGLIYVYKFFTSLAKDASTPKPPDAFANQSPVLSPLSANISLYNKSNCS